MSGKESYAIQRRDLLRRALRVFGCLLILSLVASALAAWLVNRFVVLSVEESKGQRSVLVHTPVGSFPSRVTDAATSTLWGAVYPKSEWVEQNDIDFYEGAAGDEVKVAQLVVLRFRIQLPLGKVDKWYRRRLGESFTRSQGWPANTNGEALGEWLHWVENGTKPGALVYQQQLRSRIRGALIETRLDGSGVAVTLFDFQQDKK